MIDYIFAAVFALSLLIFSHELGHFMAAKLSGIRVLRFSMGFGPVLLRWGRGETEYALSAIPFGGYVKMAGEGDEDETKGEPWEFASKPVWKRLIVVIAGPFMNLLLALVITISVIYIGGIEYVDTTRLGRVVPGSLADGAGLVVGDRILAVGETDVGNWSDLTDALLTVPGGPVNISIEREGEVVQTVMVFPDSVTPAVYRRIGVEPFERPVIGKARRRSPARRAGLRSGDEIVSIAGTPITQWGEIAAIIHESPGVAIPIVWLRDGNRMEAEVVPEEGDVLSDAPIIGTVRGGSAADLGGLERGDRIVSVNGARVERWGEVGEFVRQSGGAPVVIAWDRDGHPMQAEVVLEEGDILNDPMKVTRKGLIQIKAFYARRDVPLLEAASLGFDHTMWLAKQVLLFIKVLFTGQASRDMVGGPIRIGQMAGEMVMWGVAELFFFIAYLSVVLCLLNLLPVPVLDGGHVVFLAIEVVMRRPLSLRVRTVFQQVGFVLLLLVMALVMVLDLDKLRG
ncbi:MAG: RIP metalloprotease RseP [Candidatus Eisenbacteria sp.]|nr:RIP metalloprotease RseP [Candidatus Eisenbacteria bacterium]